MTRDACGAKNIRTARRAGTMAVGFFLRYECFTMFRQRLRLEHF